MNGSLIYAPRPKIRFFTFFEKYTLSFKNLFCIKSFKVRLINQYVKNTPRTEHNQADRLFSC